MFARRLHLRASSNNRFTRDAFELTIPSDGSGFLMMTLLSREAPWTWSEFCMVMVMVMMMVLVLLAWPPCCYASVQACRNPTGMNKWPIHKTAHRANEMALSFPNKVSRKGNSGSHRTFPGKPCRLVREKECEQAQGVKHNDQGEAMEVLR